MGVWTCKGCGKPRQAGDVSPCGLNGCPFAAKVARAPESVRAAAAAAIAKGLHRSMVPAPTLTPSARRLAHYLAATGRRIAYQRDEAGLSLLLTSPTGTVLACLLVDDPVAAATEDFQPFIEQLLGGPLYG